MRAYEITAEVAFADMEGTKTVKVFAASQGAASKARQALVDEYGVKKSTVDITEVDIPTGKEGLLGFLNELTGRM